MPAGPVAPTGPVSPAGPEGPEGPAGPVIPDGPCGPVEPARPTSPCGPDGPVAPGTPATTSGGSCVSGMWPCASSVARPSAAPFSPAASRLLSKAAIVVFLVTKFSGLVASTIGIISLGEGVNLSGSDDIFLFAMSVASSGTPNKSYGISNVSF